MALQIITTTAQTASIKTLLADPLGTCAQYFTYSKEGDLSSTDSITYVVLDTVQGLTQSAINEIVEIQTALSGALTESYEWKVCNIETALQSGNAYQTVRSPRWAGRGGREQAVYSPSRGRNLPSHICDP